MVGGKGVVFVCFPNDYYLNLAILSTVTHLSVLCCFFVVVLAFCMDFVILFLNLF